MNQRNDPGATKSLSGKKSILLMDANSERRTLRKKIMTQHGCDVVGVGDLTEASLVWHRDRYDMVLMDIRMDYRGCMAFREEIRKDSPHQVVGFLVGKPNYIDKEPALDSYVAEAYGVQWGDSLRQAVRESCDSMTQRNGFLEATWRIAAGRKISGGNRQSQAQSNVALDSYAAGIPDSPVMADEVVPVHGPLDFMVDPILEPAGE